MKCNKRLKYSNYVAFSHFHGTAVNNSGLIIKELCSFVGYTAPFIVIKLESLAYYYFLAFSFASYITANLFNDLVVNVIFPVLLL